MYLSARDQTRHGNKILKPPSGYKIIQSPKKRDDDLERGVFVLIIKNIYYKIIPQNTNMQAVATKYGQANGTQYVQYMPTAHICGKERHTQSLTTTSRAFPPLGRYECQTLTLW